MQKIIKSLVPPALWKAASELRHGETVVERSMQGVTTIHDMGALYGDRFGEAYERFVTLDPHLAPDIQRLRAYNAFMLATQAFAVPGDYLFAGISYGVMPRIVHTLVSSSRVNHLIDPFDPDTVSRASYNSSADFVRAQYAGDKNVRIHKALIPDCLPLEGNPSLAFVHLNTGNVQAEAIAIPLLYEAMVPGAVMLIDKYAFGPRGHRNIYDPPLRDLGVSIFTLPSGQGVVWKH